MQEPQIACTPIRRDSTPPTDRKDENDPIIMKCFPKCAVLSFPEEHRKTFRSASQVTDTHRAGIAIAVYLTEGLYLHRTGKGNKHCCEHIVFLRNKADCKQKHDFQRDYDLPPVDPLGTFIFMADLFCHQHAQSKRKDRE